MGQTGLKFLKIPNQYQSKVSKNSFLRAEIAFAHRANPFLYLGKNCYKLLLDLNPESGHWVGPMPRKIVFDLDI